MCWKIRFCLLHDDLNVDLGSLDFIMKTDSRDMPLLCSQSFYSLHHFHFVFHISWDWCCLHRYVRKEGPQTGMTKIAHGHVTIAQLVWRLAGWWGWWQQCIVRPGPRVWVTQPRGCRRPHTNLPISTLVQYAIHTFKLMIIGEYEDNHFNLKWANTAQAPIQTASCFITM